MKNKKKILLVVLTVVIIMILIIIAVSAIKLNRKFIYTKLDDGTWEISDYIGKSKKVIIPSKKSGRDVTRIGRACFIAKDVDYVYIPDTVTTIGNAAFRDCKSLTIDGAENVEVIEEQAFWHCEFDNDFPFSDSLISIGASAFVGVQGLDTIDLGENVEFIGKRAFCEVENADIIIPDNVKIIDVVAFGGTVIENNMKYVDYAIYGDNVLINFPNNDIVIVPEGVKAVSNTIRNESYVIKEMYIPNTVTYICDEIIMCESDLKIYIPSSVESIGIKESDKLIVVGDIDKLTLIVESGSYAESYAIENNINYEIADSVQARYEAAVASETEQ
jgi:hypothetical protein